MISVCGAKQRDGEKAPEGMAIARGCPSQESESRLTPIDRLSTRRSTGLRMRL
jgi:hypothetical protein